MPGALRWRLRRHVWARGPGAKLGRQAHVGLLIVSCGLVSTGCCAQRMGRRKRDTEQITEREVRPWLAPFVEQARRARGNDAFSASRKGADGSDLRLGHGSEVR